MRWFGHVQRKTYDAPVRRIESIIVEVREVEEDLREHRKNKLKMPCRTYNSLRT